jgi:hypothetical protein
MRSLVNKTRVTAPDADYPYGRIRDNSISAPGTPLNEEVYGDIHQFFEKMFADSGMTATELPYNDYNDFQLYEALIILINRRAYKSTSATSLLIEINASKAFTVGENYAYAVGNRVRARSLADNANYMEGVVTSYSGGVLTILTDRIGGSGTLADWLINLGNSTLKQKVLEFSAWNMDADVNRSVAHGFADITKIRGVKVTLQSDAGNIITDINSWNNGTAPEAGIAYIDATNIVLARLAGSDYDSTNYDGAGVRGWITFDYID